MFQARPSFGRAFLLCHNFSIFPPVYEAVFEPISEATMHDIARELLKVAKAVVSIGESENSLDGMSKERAKRNVNAILRRFSKGLFKDDSWRPVNTMWKALTAAQINWTLIDARYRKDDRGVPSSKEWKFEVYFQNQRDRPTTLYGIVIAAGAGSVENPLDKYDLVAYVS
jgi:hypothetical protein